MNTPEKVVAILDELASAEGPLGISDLSRRLKIGKNNIFRILSALHDKAWVEQDAETKKYGLTGALAGIGHKALSQLDIRKISHPYLNELQQITGETSALIIRVELERMFLSFIPSSHEVRHFVPVGKLLKLWYGSGGKVILAFLTKDEIETVLNEFNNAKNPVSSASKKVTVTSLRKELAQIRKQGFAMGFGERTAGTTGVAAPIFNHKHEVVGSIGVSGPEHRFDKEKALQHSTLLMETAKKISTALGAKLK